jgi:hypothetical protein
MTSSAEDVFKNKITKADAGHYYIHVFKKDGAIKTSHIKLSGYKQMLEKNPQFMYVYSLRHAGVESDLVEYLTKSGFTNSDELRTLLRDSYTSANVAMMHGNIEQEIAGIPVTKKDDKKKSVSLEYIISLKEVLDNTKSQIKRTAADDAPAAPSTPKNRGKADLDSRLDDLTEDKVLDITHYDPITDIGIKTSKRTIKGSRRPLAVSGKLSRVVCDFSKKGAENAEKALVSLGLTKDAARSAINAAQSSKTASLSRIAISPRK